MIKNICITGLGLIGGSIAKSIKKNMKNIASDNISIYGIDNNITVLQKALEEKVIDNIINKNNPSLLNQIDLLIVSIFPRNTIDYILDIIPKLKKGCIIVDCAGIKSAIIEAVQNKAKEYEVIFIGGHPMAGREVTGYESSLDNLFENASMILVPTLSSNKYAISEVITFFKNYGFKKIVICTAQEHDQIIAYTSQLAHVVSNSYVKSTLSEKHLGYSAGSYKDMTRVACLNEIVWEELFMLNKEFLVKEIDEFILNLTEMRNSIDDGNSEKLIELLKLGRERKELYK